MKELIKQNEFGISVLKKDESIVIDSRTVAELFGKPHYNVLKDIKRVLERIEGLDNEGEVKFYFTSYVDKWNRKKTDVGSYMALKKVIALDHTVQMNSYKQYVTYSHMMQCW